MGKKPGTVSYPFLAGLAAFLYYVNINWRLRLFVLVLVWGVTGGHRLLYLAYHTLGRDYRLARRGIPIVLKMAKIKRKKLTVPKLFRQTVQKRPNNVMFFDERRELTYSQVEALSNQVANMFLQLGYVKGDTVALFMENRIEYIPLWLGMAKVGVIPALINNNLRQDALRHCIHVANCRGVVTSRELEPAVTSIIGELKSSDPAVMFSVFTFDNDPAFKSTIPDAVNVTQKLKSCSSDPEPTHISDSIIHTDPLLYIYTSGTTGMPKAVIIKHFRQTFVMIASHEAIGLSGNDVIYCHLPLYHSSGGQIATASAILYGTKTFIKKKFSASAFWKDCYKYHITATQYIGEVCRYLLATPPQPEEKLHKVTKMFGNGLRPQVWTDFVTRFNIKNISEFYGATEGNSNVVNNENRVGAVGFLGVIQPEWLHALLLPLYLIRVHPETGEPIRDSSGNCIRCEPGQPGEIIGKIVQGDPLKEFNGYRDKSATDKKILTHVFRPGDKYFRSGDILVQDEFGWIYFLDRAGDTYRWKGENVSTSEVEVLVSKCLGGLGVVSYGVEIPGMEGRAGMVCIEERPEAVDVAALLTSLSNQLPSYARPLFIRFSTSLDMTGTYKLKKVKLQAEGFDIGKIPDQIHFVDVRRSTAQKLTPKLYKEITSGQIKL